MKLGEYLSQDQVSIIEPPADKASLLQYLSGVAAKRSAGLDRDAIYQGLMNRESQGSTGVGLGIAIPHGSVAGLDDNLLLVCRIRGGLEYEAIDGEPVGLAFMVLAPENRPGRYLQLLARITRLVQQAEFREQLMHQDEPGSLYRLLIEQDARHP